MSLLSICRPAFMQEEGVLLFKESVSRFCDEYATPEDVSRWRKCKIVDREIWRKAAEAGFVGLSTPEEYGGAGAGFEYEVALAETLIEKGAEGFIEGLNLHNTIVIPYILHYGSDEQKRRWLPSLTSSVFIGAIAMTEPAVGSDLQGIKTTARRNGDHYIISGQKTFITNGQSANFIIVVCKTDTQAGARGISLIVVETDRASGFSRGRNLDKVGQDAQDTSELFFDEVRVPVENLLGHQEGQGFFQLMQQLPQERLGIACNGMAIMEEALSMTIDYVKTRTAFNRKIIEFQNTQFKLAECKTEVTVARVFVDKCIELHLQNKLDATLASMAKYWVTDLENKVIDECLQLHGGYGYMNEYPIGRMFRDSRVHRIYGGTNEIMKVLISRSL